jgi:acetyltransferase-like isoleucine patch superfamily enzyme
MFHFRNQKFDFCPWLFQKNATFWERWFQSWHQLRLKWATQATIGENCFVSSKAVVVGWQGQKLRLDDGSYLAANCYVTGRVRLGKNCSVNPFVSLRDNVWCGDDVRIGAYACLIGSNHGFSDTNIPVSKQATSSKGIVLGNDVWVGSHVTIVDGVHVGEHAVLGAGSVVTKNVPACAVVAGNPARVLRMRTPPLKPRHFKLIAELRNFGDKVQPQIESLLRGYQYNNPSGLVLFRDTAEKTTVGRVRPICDAVEIAAMFGQLDTQMWCKQIAPMLQGFQNSTSGFVPETANEVHDASDKIDNLMRRISKYNTMSAHYALECLGTHLVHPIGDVENISIDSLENLLTGLSWETGAWSAGDWIDCFATSLMINRKYFKKNIPIDPLMTWLNSNVNVTTGLWGLRTKSTQLLQPVNCFYRLTRGTYAQFGLPLPMPTKTIDSLLEHAENRKYFQSGVGNACNVLDMAHPLWLCLKQTNHRRAEAEDWIIHKLSVALQQWKIGQGFSFDLFKGPASLQGTEMWLSTIYVMADILHLSGELTYKPLGIHRLESAF